MVSAKTTIQNETGLHARPANDLVKFIKSCSCNVEIETDSGKRVKGSSLLKILSLGVKKGSEITVYCDGEDEEETLKKVLDFISKLQD